MKSRTFNAIRPVAVLLGMVLTAPPLIAQETTAPPPTPPLVKQTPVESVSPASPAGKTPEAPVTPPVDQARIRRLIAELNAGEYDIREAASRGLREAGMAAFPELKKAALSSSREVAIRAVEVLAELYRTAGFPAAQPVEDLVADLREQPGAVGDLAERSWELNLGQREERTVAELRALGARVQYRPDLLDDEGKPRLTGHRPIQIIVISRAWKGGDEGLKLLARLSHPVNELNGRSEIQVYHVFGSKVSEEAMQQVADLGYHVDHRGAFLGISNGGSTLFGPRKGADVGTVSKDSPAEKAGVRSGDLITHFGDAPVADFPDLINQLKKTIPGEKVIFTILRNELELKIEAELGDW